MLSLHTQKQNQQATKNSNIFTNELLYETQRQIDQQTAQMMKIHEQLNQLSTSRVESALFDQVSKQNIKNQILVQQQPRAIGESFSSEGFPAESDTPSERPEEMKLITVLRQRLQQQIQLNKALKQRLQTLIMSQEQLESMNQKMMDQQQKDQEQLKLQQMYHELRNELFIEVQKQELQYKEFQALLLQVSQNASFDLRQIQESILNYQSILSEYGANESIQEDVNDIILAQSEENIHEVLTKSQSIIQQQNTIDLLTQQLQYVQQQITEDDLQHEDLSANVIDQKSVQQEPLQQNNNQTSSKRSGNTTQSNSDSSTKRTQPIQISYSDHQVVPSVQVVEKSLQSERLSQSINTTRISQLQPIKQDSNRIMSASSILNHATGSTTMTGSQSKTINKNMPPLPSDRSSTLNEKSATTDKQLPKSLNEDISHFNVFQRQKNPVLTQSSQILADSSSLQTQNQPSALSHMHTSQISLPHPNQTQNPQKPPDSDQNNYMQASQSYNTQGSEGQKNIPYHASSPNHSIQQGTVKQIYQKQADEQFVHQSQGSNHNILQSSQQLLHSSHINNKVDKSLQYSLNDHTQQIQYNNINQWTDSRLMKDVSTSVGPHHLSMIQNYTQTDQLNQSVTPQQLSDPYTSQLGQQFNPDGISISIQTSQHIQDQIPNHLQTQASQNDKKYQSFAMQTSLYQSQNMSSDFGVNKSQNVSQANLNQSAVIQTSLLYDSVSAQSQGTGQSMQQVLDKMNHSQAIQTSALSKSILEQYNASQQVSNMEMQQQGQQTSNHISTKQTTIQTSPIHVVSNQIQKTPDIVQKSIQLSSDINTQLNQQSSQTTAVQTSVVYKSGSQSMSQTLSNKVSQQSQQLIPQINTHTASIQTSQHLNDVFVSQPIQKDLHTTSNQTENKLMQSYGMQTSQLDQTTTEQQTIIQPKLQPFQQMQTVDAFMQTSNIISFQSGVMQPLQLQLPVTPQQKLEKQTQEHRRSVVNQVDDGVQTQSPLDQQQRVNTSTNQQQPVSSLSKSKMQTGNSIAAQTIEQKQAIYMSPRQTWEQKVQQSMQDLFNQLTKSAAMQTSQVQSPRQKLPDMQLSNQELLQSQSQQLYTQTTRTQMDSINTEKQSLHSTSVKNDKISTSNLKTASKSFQTNQSRNIGQIVSNQNAPGQTSASSLTRITSAQSPSRLQTQGVQTSVSSLKNSCLLLNNQLPAKIKQKSPGTPKSRLSASESAQRSVTPQTATGQTSSILFTRPKSAQGPGRSTPITSNNPQILMNSPLRINSVSQAIQDKFRKRIDDANVETNNQVQLTLHQEPFKTNNLSTQQLIAEQETSRSHLFTQLQSHSAIPVSDIINKPLAQHWNNNIVQDSSVQIGHSSRRDLANISYKSIQTDSRQPTRQKQQVSTKEVGEQTVRSKKQLQSVVNTANTQNTQTLQSIQQKIEQGTQPEVNINKQDHSVQNSQQNAIKNSIAQMTQTSIRTQNVGSSQLISQQLNSLQEQLYKSAGLQVSATSNNDKYLHVQVKQNNVKVLLDQTQQTNRLANSISIQTSGVINQEMHDHSVQSVPKDVSVSVQAQQLSQSASMQTTNLSIKGVDKSVYQSQQNSGKRDFGTSNLLQESLGIQVVTIPKRSGIPNDLKVTDLSNPSQKQPESKHNKAIKANHVVNKIMQSSNIQEQQDNTGENVIHIPPKVVKHPNSNKVDDTVQTSTNAQFLMKDKQNQADAQLDPKVQIPQLNDLLKRLQTVEDNVLKLDKALGNSEFTAFTNKIKQNATDVNKQQNSAESKASQAQKLNQSDEPHKIAPLARINFTNSNVAMRCSHCNSQLNAHDETNTKVGEKLYESGFGIYCDNCRIWYERCKELQKLEDPFQQLNDIAQRLLQAMQSGKLSIEQSDELLQTLHLWQAGVDTQGYQKLAQSRQEELEQQKKKLEQTDEQRKEFRRKAREERERAVELAQKLKVYQERFVYQKNKLKKQNDAIQELQMFVQEYVTQVQLVLKQLREAGTYKQEKVTTTVKVSSHKHNHEKNITNTETKTVQNLQDNVNNASITHSASEKVVISVVNAPNAQATDKNVTNSGTTASSPQMLTAADTRTSAQRQQLSQMMQQPNILTNSVSVSTPPPPAPVNCRLIFGK